MIDYYALKQNMRPSHTVSSPKQSFSLNSIVFLIFLKQTSMLMYERTPEFIREWERLSLQHRDT